MAAVWVGVVGACVDMCVGDVLGASLLRLIVQMDDLYGGVYLFCGEATSGDLLFPGVAEFFTLLHIPGTIFHPRTPNPQTDLFTGSLPVHTYPLPTHAYILLWTRILMHMRYKQQTRSSGWRPQTHLCLESNVRTHNDTHLLSPVCCVALDEDIQRCHHFTILFRSAVSSWWGYNCPHIFHKNKGLFLQPEKKTNNQINICFFVPNDYHKYAERNCGRNLNSTSVSYLWMFHLLWTLSTEWGEHGGTDWRSCL